MGIYNFAKEKRLETAKDFAEVFNAKESSKLKVSDKFFLILAKDNKVAKSRIGFAIAKKKIKLAVSRNRIKRILREQFRLAENSAIGFDMVVMANAACINASSAELVKSYHLLWERLLKQSKKRSLS